MNVNQRHAFQQIILRIMRLRTPMTTSQIAEKLSTYHTLELERIGINAHGMDFHQQVLRQLKNLEKQRELKGTLHRGKPYDTYILWDFHVR